MENGRQWQIEVIKDAMRGQKDVQPWPNLDKLLVRVVESVPCVVAVFFFFHSFDLHIMIIYFICQGMAACFC